MPATGTNKDTTPDAQQSGGQPQGTPPPGATPGTQGPAQGAGATDTSSGTRPKDNKTSNATNTGTANTGTRKETKTGLPPPPPPQVHLLQLTPELFQQTVSAAVTAALAADRESSRTLASSVPDHAPPVSYTHLTLPTILLV